VATSTLNLSMIRVSSIQFSHELRVHNSHGCSNQDTVSNYHYYYFFKHFNMKSNKQMQN
jgi:hypothetical protein